MKNLAFLLSLALLAGCASVRVSSVSGRTMADITNTGWYLFNVIPLASGNPAKPNGHSCRLFSRTVTLENNMKLLDYAVRKYGAEDFGNIVSYTTDESILFILFKRHACHTTAELILPTKKETTCESPNP